MKPRHKRLALLVAALAVLAAAAAFVLNAFQDNLVFFYTPTQVSQGEVPNGRAFRVGGMLKTGTVSKDGIVTQFVVTDTAKEITVRYSGILPDLFREGKGVVAQGQIDASGLFVATQVLAKHDENYMPPEAQHAVDQAKKAAKTLQ
jgi:cytochrome c-type biogenesis protein CcmE